MHLKLLIRHRYKTAFKTRIEKLNIMRKYNVTQDFLSQMGHCLVPLGFSNDLERTKTRVTSPLI